MFFRQLYWFFSPYFYCVRVQDQDYFTCVLDLSFYFFAEYFWLPYVFPLVSLMFVALGRLSGESEATSGSDFSYSLAPPPMKKTQLYSQLLGCQKSKGQLSLTAAGSSVKRLRRRASHIARADTAARGVVPHPESRARRLHARNSLAGALVVVPALACRTTCRLALALATCRVLLKTARAEDISALAGAGSLVEVLKSWVTVGEELIFAFASASGIRHPLFEGVIAVVARGVALAGTSVEVVDCACIALITVGSILNYFEDECSRRSCIVIGHCDSQSIESTSGSNFIVVDMTPVCPCTNCSSIQDNSKDIISSDQQSRPYSRAVRQEVSLKHSLISIRPAVHPLYSNPLGFLNKVGIVGVVHWLRRSQTVCRRNNLYCFRTRPSQQDMLTPGG